MGTNRRGKAAFYPYLSYDNIQAACCKNNLLACQVVHAGAACLDFCRMMQLRMLLMLGHCRLISNISLAFPTIIVGDCKSNMHVYSLPRDFSESFCYSQLVEHHF